MFGLTPLGSGLLCLSERRSRCGREGSKTRGTHTVRLRLHVLAAAAIGLAFAFAIASAVDAASSPASHASHAAVTASDKGKSKLDAKLDQALESGSTATIPVFVVATGDLGQVTPLLKDS